MQVERCLRSCENDEGTESGERGWLVGEGVRASTWLTGAVSCSRRPTVNIDGWWRIGWREWETCGQARRLWASAGLARRRGARPCRHRLLPSLGARRTTRQLIPMQDFHYIRHDRCYLHPVMFFDSLLRIRYCSEALTSTAITAAFLSDNKNPRKYFYPC